MALTPRRLMRSSLRRGRKSDRWVTPVSGRPRFDGHFLMESVTTGVYGQAIKVRVQAAAGAANKPAYARRLSESLAGYHLAGAEQRSRRALHSTGDQGPGHQCGGEVRLSAQLLRAVTAQAPDLQIGRASCRER